MDMPSTRVHCMLRHSDVSMAITCLGSLTRYSQEPLSLVIHDEGSLTEEDSGRLVNAVQNVKIIRRDEADGIVLKLIEHYPNICKFRQEDIFSLKLIDVPLLESEDIAYCDSDILFFRPFRGLFRWPDDKTAAIFMMDPLDECYSVRPWHLSGKNALKLPGRVNVGLIFFRKKRYDLDFVEWFLGKNEYKKIPIARWIEPTCWAAMGYRAGCRLWDPKQILLMRSGTKITDEAVAGHFVAMYRGKFEGTIRKLSSTTANSAPAAIRSIEAGRCGVFRLGISQIRRRFRNTFHYFLTCIRGK